VIDDAMFPGGDQEIGYRRKGFFPVILPLFFCLTGIEEKLIKNAFFAQKGSRINRTFLK